MCLKGSQCILTALRNTPSLGKLEGTVEGGTMLSGVVQQMVQDTQEGFTFEAGTVLAAVAAVVAKASAIAACSTAESGYSWKAKAAIAGFAAVVSRAAAP